MSADGYVISESRVVIDQLTALVGTAADAAERRHILRATRWAMSELARTPYEFGESRSYWPHARLHERIAFVHPLAFFFGIHEDSRTVFIIRITRSKRD